MPRSLAEIQSLFGAALVDPSQPVPEGVVAPDGGADSRRFAVYRNNVMVGLIEALGARFPVTQRLVGDAFFRELARAYATGHKPRSALLLSYGDDFPAFIAGFGPAATVPYLADMARLEVARSEAYHAPEADPLGVEALRPLRAEDLAQARLRLHPSLRLVRSAYPVATIWAAHQSTGEVRPPQAWKAEDVAVIRPEADVLLHRLPPGAHGFIAALMAGAGVREAVAPALEEDENFDPGHHLMGLFHVGAVIALDIYPKCEVIS